MPLAALAAAVLCACIAAAPAMATITDPGAFLDETEHLRIRDHRQFAERLAKIHREAPPLTPAEQWHLRYLDAFEATLQGDYAAADKPLRAVIDQSGDPTLAAKASAVLLSNLAISHRYEDAFQLAHQLTIQLPAIRDKATRFMVLANLSQMLNFAGQPELALQYARMMEDTVPPGATLCDPRFKQMAALYNAKKLTASSTALEDTVKLCKAAGQPIIAAATELIISTLDLEEHQPRRALALLDRIAPSLQANRYYPHLLSAQTQRAQAYEQLGRDDEARKTALAVLADAHPGEVNNFLTDIYELLYQLAERHGQPAAALAYYKQYIAQKQGALDDAAAQALAYQTIQQQVLTRKLEAKELGRQNSVLRLQRALDAKAVETGRLYIALLLLTLAAIGFWLVRTLRSKRHFKGLASRDALTGILNHQHFMSECDRLLRGLVPRHGRACLAWIDLDHFKQINDTHGHATGDVVLRHAVQVCREHLRPGDLFGRLGGEEFGILLGDCTREQAIAIADRIRLAIEASPMVLDDSVVSISASIGVASTATSGHDLQRLCRDADAALYRAKRAGRNRVVADGADDRLIEA
jgi:diguanylate cyclase (GGDEF)-like protein